mgnify:FL=1|tara:strand:- start:10789 stop:10968 length:180 start_codon:yes stop_codon:yes gene_type:complete
MITENDIIIDDIADEVFENIEQAIDRELAFIMEEYGLNIDMINRLYYAWLMKENKGNKQ